jgi:hypothetical protein
MDDIKAKALALMNEVRAERGCLPRTMIYRDTDIEDEALCRAIEQHEAFKQEVSDVVDIITSVSVDDGTWRRWVSDRLSRFIIPKPKLDPLEEVIKEWWNMDIREDDAETLRELLEARGLEIREKGQ